MASPSSTLLSYAPVISPVSKRVLEYDWASTPLGPIEQWAQSLKTTVSIMLANPSQACIFWGPDRTLIFNDAWATISGSKLRFLGQPGRVAFPEIWDTFSVHCESASEGKQVGRVDDLLFLDPWVPDLLTSSDIPIQDDGDDGDTPPLLETYFSWSYLPVQVENGKVGGILNNCTETTEKVLSERRMLTVRTLAELTAPTRTTSEFWKAVADSLALNEYDFPFFLCYSATNTYTSFDGSDATDTLSNVSYDFRSEKSCSSSSVASVQHLRLDLIQCCGVQPGHPAAPIQVDLNPLGISDNKSWPFSKACFDRTSLRAKNPHPDGFEVRGWNDKPGDAVLIPIFGPDNCLVGMTVFGLNSRRPYDEHYMNFHQTLMRNLNASFVATQAFERELQRTEELQALDRAKTLFFQNVSHELRTPLTLIHGPCEDALKEEEKLDPPTRSRFKLISRACARLLRLVNSLMLFSSAEAKRLQATYRPVQLGAVTSDLASLFRSAVEKAGISYVVDCDSDDEREIFVDLSMWEKIIFNLLSNAIKYTAEGQIKLSLCFRSSDVELQVDDTGCGIPQDQKDLVLQRFHRVYSAEGRSSDGTGIGLALTSELVKLHGGTIKVESSLGKGSSFIVRIPRGYTHLPAKDVNHNPDPALLQMLAITTPGAGDYLTHNDNAKKVVEKSSGYGSYAKSIVEEANGWLGDDSETASTLSESSGSDSLAATQQPLSVLLAEDNEDARSYIKSILSTVAHVTAVNDGRAALDHIRNRKFDLVVTDVMMPFLTGTDLLQELANDPNPNIQNIPVIVLTARSGSEGDADLRNHSLLQGPVDYLLKPFSSAELLRRVQTRIHSIRQKQELKRQVQERTAELDQAQQMYRRMTELAPVAIFQVDADEVDRGLITFANERFFTLTGLPRSLPLRFDEIINLMETECQSTAEVAWNDVLEFGTPVNFEFKFLNGRHALAEAVGLSSGSILGTLTDQTEQRLLAAQQLIVERQKTDEAIQQKRLQEAFVDIVSHELRNPISAILQSADLLSGSVARLGSILQELFGYCLNSNKSVGEIGNIQKLIEESRVEVEDATHAVASIELCARHQTIIASDILVVSRLDSEFGLSLRSISFHLMQELQNTISMFSVQAETQSIKFLLDPGPDVTDETRIIADPTRLCQILVNLISNSCRALESWDGRRQISLKVSLSSSRPFEVPGHNHNHQSSDPTLEASRVWVSFFLTDTGPGVPVKDQARLFTRFNDVHTVTASPVTRRSSSLGGSGLGLYLCRKLAELQGGGIVFNGASGQGASFCFFIEARIADNAPSIITPYSIRTNERFSKNGMISPGLVAPILPAEEVTPKMTPLLELPAQQADYFVAGFTLRNPTSGIFEKEQADRGQFHVLIVEDNAINQKLLKRQIEKAGFLAHATNNGLEALQYLETANYMNTNETPSRVYPLLILMDLEMPVLDGLEATSRIRNWEATGKLPQPKIPIFAVTGNARQGQVDAAIAVGMPYTSNPTTLLKLFDGLTLRVGGDATS